MFLMEVNWIAHLISTNQSIKNQQLTRLLFNLTENVSAIDYLEFIGEKMQFPSGTTDMRRIRPCLI